MVGLRSLPPLRIRFSSERILSEGNVFIEYMRHFISHTHTFPIAALLAAALFLPFYTLSAETRIENSVSVSASGDGVSRTSVTTIIDGEVVEDWATSTTGTVTYTSEHQVSTSEPTPEERTRLNQMIEQLLALISFYESLLNR